MIGYKNRYQTEAVICLAWSVLLSTTIRVITVIKSVDSRGAVSPQQLFPTVMTRIVVDKSSDHAKPHFDLFFYRNVNVKDNVFQSVS